MKEPNNSFFDRVISKSRGWRGLLGMAFLFVITLLVAVILDGALEDLTKSFTWRGLLIPPIIIIYILAIAPGMQRMGKGVMSSFQAILSLDDKKFQETIHKFAKIEPRRELAAIGIGFSIGVFAALGSMEGELTWVTAYWLITTITMYTLLVWTIYISIASTRIISALLNQPLNVDPFNTKPFEPIGRQSLTIALVFVGGITISLIFIGLDFSSFRQPLFWLIYVPLAMVPVILFFLNMFPTHRVLADAKNAELTAVREQLHKSCRALLNKMEKGQETYDIPNEINALAVYEKQLKETRTWPYNTAMLRTLFFSVLIPVGTLVGRIIVEALAN
jgi:hypothetical protein